MYGRSGFRDLNYVRFMLSFCCYTNSFFFSVYMELPYINLYVNTPRITNLSRGPRESKAGGRTVNIVGTGDAIKGVTAFLF